MKTTKTMKTFRYLLVVLIVLLAPLPVVAQSSAYNTTYNSGVLAVNDSYQFRSTSTMVSCGSLLPMSAQTGTMVTNEVSGVTRGIRKIGGNTSGGSGDREEPMKNPIGEGTWFLLLLAAAYAGYMFRRRMVVQAECIDNK